MKPCCENRTRCSDFVVKLTVEEKRRCKPNAMAIGFVLENAISLIEVGFNRFVSGVTLWSPSYWLLIFWITFLLFHVFYGTTPFKKLCGTESTEDAWTLLDPFLWCTGVECTNHNRLQLTIAMILAHIIFLAMWLGWGDTQSEKDETMFRHRTRLSRQDTINDAAQS